MREYFMNLDLSTIVVLQSLSNDIHFWRYTQKLILYGSAFHRGNSTSLVLQLSAARKIKAGDEINISCKQALLHY